MAKPMTPDQMITAFRAAGITIREYPGWRTRCRCCVGAHRPAARFYIRGWGNVNGGVQHITAGGLGKRSVESYIRDIIVSDRKTPSKCQWVIDPGGVLWLVAAGRCNHAGKVGARFRNAMVAETLPLSGYVDLRGHDTDGNSFSYGIECIAASKMTGPQHATSTLVWAAVCKHHGWDAGSIGGHGEGSDQRAYSDPNENMGAFRQGINAAIAGLGSGSTTFRPPTPTTAPEPIDEPTITSRPTKPTLAGTVSVSELKRARYADPPKSGTPLGPYADEVFTLESALAATGWLDRKHVDGHYGSATVGDGSLGVGGVTGFQRKHSGARRPDGWLGKRELRKLFKLAGMKVRVID